MDPAAHETAENCASELGRWNPEIFATEVWISDQVIQFINSTFKSLAHDHRISHKQTVAYETWVNFTVKRLKREVISAARDILEEAKLAPQDRTEVLRAVRYVLNVSPSPLLGTNRDSKTRTTMQAMTGAFPKRVMVQIVST